MRQIFLIAAFLLSVAAPSLAQEQLVVGNSYSGNIKLSSSNGGIYLPLLEGTWVLTSLEKLGSKLNEAGSVPMLGGSLVAIDDQKRVTGIMVFYSGNDSAGGWQPQPLCYRKDLFFVHTEVQRRGNRETRCWAVSAASMAAPTATAPNSIRDYYQYVHKNDFKLPQTTINVTIIRSSSAKFLQATYYRNPELDGFPRAATTAWQKDVVVGDAKRLKYLEDVKAWGEQWQPTFDAAFAGRPK